MGGSVKFACLVPSENVPIEEEIAENKVNVATRQINLANALGADDREWKNRPVECSSIIDTGFNGGGLSIFAWLRKYLEYQRSFPPKENMEKTREKVLKLVFAIHQGRDS